MRERSSVSIPSAPGAVGAGATAAAGSGSGSTSTEGGSRSGPRRELGGGTGGAYATSGTGGVPAGGVAAASVLAAEREEMAGSR
jgi:hypothetical protein